MSLKLPKSNNVQEFADNLYNKVMCTEFPNRRYGNNVHPDVPKRMGILGQIRRFDAGYFGKV